MENFSKNNQFDRFDFLGIPWNTTMELVINLVISTAKTLLIDYAIWGTKWYPI